MIATSSLNYVGINHKLDGHCVDDLPSAVVQGRRNPLHFGLPSRLKKARNAARLSFDAVAEAAGLTDGSTVVHLERKEGHVPRLETVEKVARALGMAPSFLAFGIEGEARPDDGLGAAGVGTRLRLARQAQGLSVLALATAAGVSHTAVTNIEHGTMPTVATTERLAVSLGVCVGWLGFGSGKGIKSTSPAGARTKSRS